MTHRFLCLLTVLFALSGSVLGAYIENDRSPLAPNTPKLLGPGSNFTTKINKQLPKRGWTQRRVQSVTDRPVHTSPALNRATGNKATAFFDKNGAYVVRENATGDIIQISNRLDPKWVPDPTITNPFIP